MEHDLEQQVAELVAQCVEILFLNGVRDFIRLFERIGRDGSEVLLPVPGAAPLRVAEQSHDAKQALQGVAHRGLRFGK